MSSSYKNLLQLILGDKLVIIPLAHRYGTSEAMLFNSFIFIFLFLPITIGLFFYSAKYSSRAALSILFVASMIFYGWNNYHYVFLLLFSILINFIVGKYIVSTISKNHKKYFLYLGVTFNLFLLGYFKYTNFFIQNMNTLVNTHFPDPKIILPIGISFFTFTQIAFLVDCYRGFVQKYHFLNYALFVTYFPHLIAGPIIHHKEVMPQFEKKRTFQMNYRNLMIGIVIFSMGLFKKTMIADHLAVYVSPVYDILNSSITCLDAWLSSLAYTLELYFDFSGYSDMAIGLSMLIGVKLPINFYSPYKSKNIIEFWRRWNMTLSRFLRDYLYIPLGGNRKGKVRRYINLMLTMFLGGLWHGASWTFVVWGTLHGVYLCINHGWIVLKEKLGLKKRASPLLEIFSCFFTFIFVIIAWIFFRAPNFSVAHEILSSMFFKPLSLPGYWPIPSVIKELLVKIHVGFIPQTTWTPNDPVASFHCLMLIFISLLIVWLMPNSYQIMRKYRPALLPTKEKITSWVSWRPNLAGTTIAVAVLTLDIIYIHGSSIFLYFRF